MYGEFSDEHRRVVRGYVRGARVIDIGSGDGERATILAAMGAKDVLAVDHSHDARYQFGPGVRFLRTSAFSVARQSDKLREEFDVAHVSWPSANRSSDPLRGLVLILEQIDTVIYVGSNVGGTACGTPDLFDHFRSRRVLAYEPSKRNTLIVYGQPLSVKRPFVLHEEWCGLNNHNLELAPQMYSASRELIDAEWVPPPSRSV